VAENAVERRLAAILAADVVGYSKLMGRDEAGTLAALRKLRSVVVDPKITEHKGRPIQGNDVLMVLEATKMETTITSPVAGRLNPA